MAQRKPKMQWPEVLAKLHMAGMTLTELAERVDVFEGAGVEGVKAPALVNGAYRVNELPFGGDNRRRSIRKSPRLAGFRPALLRALLLVR